MLGIYFGDIPHKETGAGGSAQAPLVRSQRALAEVRRAFAPYDQSGRLQRRSQPSTSRASFVQETRRAERQLHHRICCLGGPDDVVLPVAARTEALETSGLGLRALHISKNAGEDLLKAEILKLYPKLSGTEFEILRAIGGGNGKRLVRVSPDRPVPTVSDIDTLVGTSIVYIRPLSFIGGTTAELESINEATPRLRQCTLPFVVPCSSSASVQDGGLEPAQVTTTPRIENTNVSDVREPELLTIADWRDKLYSDYENGETFKIFIQRDDFAASVLGLYKKQVDLYKQPEVIFAGEAGADAGALTKEFFWMGMCSIRDGKLNGRLPFFEGEQDFKLPTCDGSLVRLGIFELIGKFMLHASIHMGIAFVALSDVVRQYVMLDKVDFETPLEIGVADLPDQGLRDIIVYLDRWLEQRTDPAQEDMKRLETVAIENDFHDAIRIENAAII